MKGKRPPQAELTTGNDLSKTEETRNVVASMIDGLNDHEIEGIEAFFSKNFRWFILIYSFVLGISLDILEGNIGLNASSLVFTAFITPYIQKITISDHKI